MRQKLTKSIPPWELASRIAYKRRNAQRGVQKISRAVLHTCLNDCTKAIESGQLKAIGRENTPITGVSLIRESDPDLPSWNPFEEVNIKLQHLGLIGLNKRDKKMLTQFIQKIEPFLTESSTVFRFLSSVSSVISIRCRPNGSGIKSTCNPTFESLFNRLNDTVKPFQVVTCYLKLCAFYGQKVATLSPIYHAMVDALTSWKCFITEQEMDDLLFLYERLSITDKRIMGYFSKRMADHFDCFTENQICNFARYLVKSLYAHSSPDVISPPPDYSRVFSHEETKDILDGFEVNSSDYVRCLESRLPVCLHQYSYFNLIDLGEFYDLFNIASDIRIRFSTELWKYLYTLKYGYPIKSLVILSKLGLGDSKTFGRLIRNIPQTLAFRWPISLVTECLINLEGAKKEKIYVILAHYICKRLCASFPGHNVARIFDSLRNKRVAVLGLYQKVLAIQSLNPTWLTVDNLFHIARYGKDTGFSVQQVFELLKANDLETLSKENAVTLFSMMDNMDTDILKKLVKVLGDTTRNEPLEFDSLMELLNASKRLNIRMTFIHRICMEALETVETIEAPILLELMELLSSFGQMEHRGLMDKMEAYIYFNLEHLPLRSTGRMLWYSFSIGMTLISQCFQALLRHFNRLYDAKYNEDHLLQVLGAFMMKLDSHSPEIRTFLRNLEYFKDVSWRRTSAEIDRIRTLEKAVNCNTFVSVFPFTADIEITVQELRRYITQALENGVTPERCHDLDRQIGFYMQKDENTVYLDLCQDPFIIIVDQCGTLIESLSFYHQLRNHLVGKPFLHIMKYNL